MEYFKNDKVMVKVIESVGECTIGNNKQQIFSYLIGLIIGQKITFRKAQDIRRKMYEIMDNYNYTPGDLILLSDDQWEEIGVESYVKDIIVRVTKKFIDDKIDITNVTKDTIIDLKNIKGIGEVDCINIIDRIWIG